MQMRLRDNVPVMSFLEDWQGVLDEAALAGLAIPEAQQITMLLAALPPSWRPFVTTQANIAGLTLPTLINRICQEDVMRNGRSDLEPRSPGSALAATSSWGRGRGRTNQQHSGSSDQRRNPGPSSFNPRGRGNRSNMRRRFSGRGRQ